MQCSSTKSCRQKEGTPEETQYDINSDIMCLMSFQGCDATNYQSARALFGRNKHHPFNASHA